MLVGCGSVRVDTTLRSGSRRRRCCRCCRCCRSWAHCSLTTPPAAAAWRACLPYCRPVRGRRVAPARGAARGLPLQVALDRLCQQDLPPKRGRGVSARLLSASWVLRCAGMRRAGRTITCLSTDSACCCALLPNARRSGSVCLDVINQTWSPMFGECVQDQQQGRAGSQHDQRWQLATWHLAPQWGAAAQSAVLQLTRPLRPLPALAACLPAHQT